MPVHHWGLERQTEAVMRDSTAPHSTAQHSTHLSSMAATVEPHHLLLQPQHLRTAMHAPACLRGSTTHPSTAPHRTAPHAPGQHGSHGRTPSPPAARTSLHATAPPPCDTSPPPPPPAPAPPPPLRPPSLPQSPPHLPRSRQALLSAAVPLKGGLPHSLPPSSSSPSPTPASAELPSSPPRPLLLLPPLLRPPWLLLLPASGSPRFPRRIAVRQLARAPPARRARAWCRTRQRWRRGSPAALRWTSAGGREGEEKQPRG
ncbi:unnamed protein product [Closterium sp. NIES-54]